MAVLEPGQRRQGLVTLHEDRQLKTEQGAPLPFAPSQQLGQRRRLRDEQIQFRVQRHEDLAGRGQMTSTVQAPAKLGQGDPRFVQHLDAVCLAALPPTAEAP